MKLKILVIGAVNDFYFFIKKNRLKNIDLSEKNILVINPQGYGDTIMMTSMLRELKSTFSTCNIFVVVSSKGYEVLKECKYVDKLILYSGRLPDYFNLVQEINNLHIEVCFDLQITLSNFRRWFFSFLVGSKYRLYFKRGGFRGFLPSLEINYPSNHMIDNYLEIIKPFVKYIKNKRPEVFFSKKDELWAKEIIRLNEKRRKVILIHTYSENKNHLWQTDKWVSIAEELCKNNVVLFISPEEGIDYVKNIVGKMKNKSEIIVPDTFNKLAALISESDLLITIDTSTVHISSATKTPAVIIYGPTILNFWGPINENQISLQKDTVCRGKCREYNLNKIFASRELCREYNDNCINYITEEEVIRESKNLLK